MGERRDFVDIALGGMLGLCGLFLVALLLSGIYVGYRAATDGPVGSLVVVPNVIADISYSQAHKERRAAGKTSRLVTIPDRWFILFCRKGTMTADCFTRTIEHSPWAWQAIGAEVVAEWQPYRNSGWRLERQGLIDRCVEANNAAHKAEAAMEEYCLALYGFTASDKDYDSIIDAVFGGCGVSAGMLADEFDKIMREGEHHHG